MLPRKKELLEKMEDLNFKQIVMMWQNRGNISAKFITEMEDLRDEMLVVWNQYREIEMQETFLN